MVKFIHSANYAEAMGSEVMPFLSERRHDGYVKTAGGNIHYVMYRSDDGNGTVYISHGFTENSEKYRETAYYFLINGFSVCIPEHFGHGFSSRATDDVSVTHIDRFEQYADDLEEVINKTKEMCKGPYYLYSHSMGGAAGLLYLERNTGFFSAAVLSSPMIVPSSGGTPIPVAKAVMSFFKLIGKSKERSFTSSEYPGKEEFEDSCSICPERFAYYEKIKRENERFHNYSPSYGWIYESLRVKKLILKGNPERITTPVLIFSAENDTVVEKEPQKKLEEIIRNCRFESVPSAKHEIYLSTDEIVEKYFDDIISFFKAN